MSTTYIHRNNLIKKFRNILLVDRFSMLNVYCFRNNISEEVKMRK